MLVKIDNKVFQTDDILTMDEYISGPKCTVILLGKPGGSYVECHINRSLDYVVKVMNLAAVREALDRTISQPELIYGDLTVQNS